MVRISHSVQSHGFSWAERIGTPRKSCQPQGIVVVVVVAILVVAVVGAADAVANLQERPKRGEWGTKLE